MLFSLEEADIPRADDLQAVVQLGPDTAQVSSRE
jgi:hypothetical protein